MTSRRPPDQPEPAVDPLLEVHQEQQGQRPGDRYVKIVRPFDDEFERGDEGQLIATDETLDTRGGVLARLRGLRTVLIGKPIPTEHEQHERLTKVKALAILSSDNISSSAYGPEEIMRVLVTGGVALLALTLPIAAAIILMLAVVAMSYRQTIKAYPNGASSYIVAGDNLGDMAGVVAAAALLIGYVVTVAVSISAGVAALSSIAPAIFPFRVWISLAAIGVLTLGNLRGIRESGAIFMAPTYLYIGLMLTIVGWGMYLTVTGTMPPYTPPPEFLMETGFQAVGILLILRAFSHGAVALTGVEAISDGVPAFKPPEWRNARTTLTWAAVVFGVLFLGIAYLAMTIGLVPDPAEKQTILSLLVRHIAGSGWILILAQISTALLLVLAANTSFADFPRLSSFLARDGFMPRQFAFRGERLAFTTGILALSGMAGVLVIVFAASVAGLIPLYTLGVFIAFTLSQTGMALRWWHRREPGWRRGLAINGAGALTTAGVALVVGVSNFSDGAWLVMVLVPSLMVVLMAIRRHYRWLAGELTLDEPGAGAESAPPPIVVVPVAELDLQARAAIGFAHSISPQPTVVHITSDPTSAEELKRRWPAWAAATDLVIVESPYRAMVGPFLRYLDAIQAQAPERQVVVVLSELVPRHWWENILHNQTSLRLKLRLFRRRNTVVADVPFHLPA